MTAIHLKYLQEKSFLAAPSADEYLIEVSRSDGLALTEDTALSVMKLCILDVEQKRFADDSTAQALPVISHKENSLKADQLQSENATEVGRVEVLNIHQDVFFILMKLKPTGVAAWQFAMRQLTPKLGSQIVEIPDQEGADELLVGNLVERHFEDGHEVWGLYLVPRTLAFCSLELPRDGGSLNATTLLGDQ